jgi:atypical dual specificity phosphatase
MRITGVVDMRAEREAEAAFFAEHDIALRQYFVPDVTVPDEEILTDAVGAITTWVGEGRTVLIHCAKGRGRSATVLAAYLMKTEGMSFEQVSEFLTGKRALVKLQDRHREVLEPWIAKQDPAPTPRPG